MPDISGISTSRNISSGLYLWSAAIARAPSPTLAAISSLGRDAREQLLHLLAQGELVSTRSARGFIGFRDRG